MTLTLTIRNFAALDNGMPVEFVLHRRGALIGRSPTCDWSLPDAQNYISSRHGEIVYADGAYVFTDISTNGTLLNGSGERMREPRAIAPGDLFTIGQYEVIATLSGEAVAAIEREAQAASAAQQGNWGGWDSHGAQAPPAPPPSADSGWGAPAPAAAASGWGNVPATPAAGGWAPQAAPSLAQAPPHRAGSFGSPPPAPSAPASSGWAPSASAPLAPISSAWDQPREQAQAASGWSSAAPDRPVAASPDDVWGKIAEGNVVDWARGGFGQPIQDNRDPLGLDQPAARDSLGGALPTPQSARFGGNDGWGAPAPPAQTQPPLAIAPAPAPSPPPPPTAGAPSTAALVGTFVKAAGLDPAQVKDMSPATLDRAGQLFRRLVAGLVVMVEARARAKSQMGAEATSFAFDGNNPIKFARTPEEAIAALLNPQIRGFMEAGRAIDDSYGDLQSHQMATLRAMQGALRATLDRFSPTAIRKRAETGGILSRILPGARDAALWQAYEKEFGGVAQGSDEAFMDVFAKEFRKAYDEQAGAGR